MNQELDFFKIEHNDLLPEKGRVLVSEPFLQDAYFKRSVVLLTEHNEEGTLGFVLNNPIDFDATDILKDFPPINALVGIGGPVVHYLHCQGDLIPESVHVIGSVFWGGDFNAVQAMIKAGELTRESIRFFVGFSSWYPGQLDREIAENSWLVTTIDPDALLKEERKYQMWTRYPEDPLLN